ncbi:GntR family transcriptional regulator [Pollutimonas nitritireducens]|uniref:GntR family transcriptional regulator n=1 Tax=Pollutimonas nitritireducens TaxID=2045209 RepID=A0A2N4UJZ2_9BURK|nr:DoxX family protein [Pollutimonas nitritireducens]PLC55341.1 GntR family transcriptional regulator [Pollutimonas nitritireducens]
MSTATQEDLAKLILRLAIGIFIVLHGIAKMINGVGPIEGMMVARGLPAFFAWAVYIGEVLAPLMLILGLYTRLGALLIALNMVVAVALAHSGQLMQLGGSGGWRLELQGLFLFGSIAIALLGAGRFSVGGRGGSWN